MESLLVVLAGLFVGGCFLTLTAWLSGAWPSRRGRRYPVPVSDHILVRPILKPLEVGGMARPLSSAERPSEGRVVLVGPGKVSERGVRVRPEVERGDRVSFPSFAGQTVVDPPGVEPGTYLLVRQDEIWLNHGPSPEESECHE